MNNQNNQKGLSDIALVIIAYTVIGFLVISEHMYVTVDQIDEAEFYCQNRGGLKKYFVHFGADKFECDDGKVFVLR